jgi:transcriptional regulator with XRE-family HTH domain
MVSKGVERVRKLPGSVLGSERQLRELTQREVADALGVARQRVTTIEALERVPPRLAARYRRAIDDARRRRPRYGTADSRFPSRRQIR